MIEKNLFESNRAAWNQAAVYHQRAFNHSLHIGFQDPKFSTLKKERNYVVNERLKQIDFSGKTISHIPCNNGRELLSLMRLGAKEGVGFDISDAAISEALLKRNDWTTVFWTVFCFEASTAGDMSIQD